MEGNVQVKKILKKIILGSIFTTLLFEKELQWEN